MRRTDFEKVCDRTKELLRYKFDKDIYKCAIKALELEVSNKKFIKICQEFGTTKTDYLNKVVSFIENNGQIKGQIDIFTKKQY